MNLVPKAEGMTVMLKKLHLSIGLLGLLGFIVSGQYFHHVLDGLQALEDGPRLLLRSSHIYLFLTSAINVSLGLFLVQENKPHWFVVLNHSLLLLSPFLVGYGLVFETLGNAGIDRPVGSLGLFAVFIWLFNVVLGKLIVFFKSGN